MQQEQAPPARRRITRRTPEQRRQAQPRRSAEVAQPEQEQPVTRPSLGRRVGAGALRVGSSLLASPFAVVPGVGNAVAGLIGAGGELAAQAVEENSLSQLDPQSLGRAAVEGGLAAVPFSAVTKAGRMLTSAVRSGAMSGAGEGMRQVLRDGDIDPLGIGTATVLGGLTGGVLSRFTPAPNVAPPGPRAPKTLEEALGANRRLRATDPRRYTPTKVAEKAASMEAAGLKDKANALREASMRADPTAWNPGVVATEAARLESYGKHAAAHGLRVAARETGKFNRPILDKITAYNTGQLNQEVKNLNTIEKFKEALQKAQTRREIAEARRQWQEHVQHANILTQGQKAQARRTAADLARTRLAELQKDGGTWTTAASQKGTAIDPATGQPTTVTARFKPKSADDADDLDEGLDTTTGGGGGGRPNTGAPSAGAAPIAQAAPKTAAQHAAEVAEAAAAKEAQRVAAEESSRRTSLELAKKNAENTLAAATDPNRPTANPDIVAQLQAAIKDIEEKLAKLGGTQTAPTAAKAADAPAAPAVPAVPTTPLDTLKATLQKKQAQLAKTKSPQQQAKLSAEIERLAARIGAAEKASVSKAADLPVTPTPAGASSAAPSVGDVDDVLETAVDNIYKRMLPAGLYDKIAKLAANQRAARIAKDEETLQELGMKKSAALRAAQKAGEVPPDTEKKIRAAIKQAREEAAARKALPSNSAEITEAAMRSQLAESGVAADDMEKALLWWRSGVAPSRILETLGAPPRPPQGALPAVTPLSNKTKAGFSELPKKQQKVARERTRRQANREMTAHFDAEGIPRELHAVARALYRGSSETLGKMDVIKGLLGLGPAVLPASAISNKTAQTMRSMGMPVLGRGADVTARQTPKANQFIEELGKKLQDPKIPARTKANQAAQTAQDALKANAAARPVAKGPLSAQQRMADLGYAPEDWAEMSLQQVQQIVAKGIRKGQPLPEVLPVATPAAVAPTPAPAARPAAPRAGQRPAQPPVQQTSGTGAVLPTPTAGQAPAGQLDGAIARAMDALEDARVNDPDAVLGLEARVAELQKLKAELPANPPTVTKPTGDALKPRLVKPGKKTSGTGGTTLGSGFGALQALPELLQKYPNLTSEIILAASGAGAGALLNQDDPLTGALIGAGAGAAVLPVLSGLKAFGVALEDVPELTRTPPESLRQWIPTFGRIIPDYVRFAYLASAAGLPANAIVGPWGAAFFGALTKIGAGDSRGWVALKALNPVNAWRHMKPAIGEAVSLVNHAEEGSALMRSELGASAGAPDAINALWKPAQVGIRFPAYAMTTGDVTVRNILKNAGFSEDEAREMTLTAEPFLKAMKGLINFRNSAGPIGHIAAPFVRTPANIAEQGGVSILGFGSIIQNYRQKQGAAAMGFREQAVRQGLGSLMFGVGFAAGANLTPEQARIYRRYLTNGAGMYGLPASLGFALGQGYQRGGWAAGSQGLGTELGQAFPWPTSEPFTDAWSFGTRALSGDEVPALPRTLEPALLRETGISELYNPTNTLRTIPTAETRVRRRITRRNRDLQR